MSEPIDPADPEQAMIRAPAILCRPALPSDRAPVMDFLQQIWGGEDYVVDVWDDWVQDSRGLLAVALISGQPVGLSHLADLGEGEYWLEGLRVDPEFRGLHVGSHLHDYFVSVWEGGPGWALRLASMESRADVHHLAQRTGFRRIAAVTGYQAEPQSGQPAFASLHEGDLQTAMQELRAAPTQASLAGLIDLGWQFATASDARLRSMLEEGMLLSWRDGLGVAAVALSDRRGGTDAYLHAVASSPEDLLPLLQDVRRLASQRNADQVFWLMPTEPSIQETSKSAGFSTDWQESLLLFERLR